MELVNMWNIKPHHDLYGIDTNKSQYHHLDTMFSSSHLLTQLLISQAILDSNDFKVLTFDKLDKLKKVIQTYCVCLHRINFNILLHRNYYKFRTI